MNNLNEKTKSLTIEEGSKESSDDDLFADPVKSDSKSNSKEANLSEPSDLTNSLKKEEDPGGFVEVVPPNTTNNLNFPIE